MRKDAGLELTDRIVLTLPDDDVLAPRGLDQGRDAGDAHRVGEALAIAKA